MPPPPRFSPPGGGGAAVGVGALAADAGIAPLGEARVRYPCKVYALLAAAALLAIFVGVAVIELSPTEKLKDPYGRVVAVPMLRFGGPNRTALALG